MANTDISLASTEETLLAIGKYYELQENNPNQLEGLLQKHPEANPFTHWPLHKKETLAFLGLFGMNTKEAPAQRADASGDLGSQRSIDAKKLDDLIAEFDKEIEAARAGQIRIETTSKTFVKNLVEAARRAGVPIPESAATLPAEGAVGARRQYPEPPFEHMRMPISEESMGAPVSPERVREIVAAVIQQPSHPEEKMGVVRLAETLSAQHPDKPVAELVPRATAVAEAAKVLSAPEGSLPRETSFTVLAANGFQKNVAGALNVVIRDPEIKEAIINKVLLQPLDTIVNHPESIPQSIMGEMVNRWGENFVDSSWFSQLRTDANRMMADQRGEAKIKSKLNIFVSDVAGSVFGSPIDNVVVNQRNNILIFDKGVLSRRKDFAGKIGGAFERGKNVLIIDNKTPASGISILVLDANVLAQKEQLAAKIGGALALGKNLLILDKKSLSAGAAIAGIQHNVIAYIETYRMFATQGVPMGNISHYGNIALGYGGQIFRMGADYAVRAGVKAIAKKAATRAAIGAATKAGVSVVAGAATGGTATLALLGADLLRGIFNKGTAVLKRLLFMGNSKNPEDNLLLVVGAGIVLMFFLPIFPLLNIPAFNQSMIDTSIATSIDGGAGPSGAEGMSTEPPVAPPNFGPINGSITDCITSQGTNIEGTQTLTLTADRASQIQTISQQYPQLGCYSQVLNCPTTKINVTAFAVQSGGLGGYAPSGVPGNIIFYPAFFAYSDYYFARTLAHEMMHEVQWLQPEIYDAFMNGTTDGSFQKGDCGPLGTYTAGNENSYESMAEAAALYLVGNPLLQQLCPPAYNFMQTLFSQCQI